MPRGAKTAKSCTVETCTLESGQIPTVSIFQLRRIKGWWPFLRTDESNPSEKEVTVSQSNFQVFSPPNYQKLKMLKVVGVFEIIQN